jgi:tRNA acetyltransferase TAN1
VLKNVYGLSVVEGRLWRGKKFNLEGIATEVRHRKLREEEAEKAAEKEGAVEGVETQEVKDVKVAEEVAPTTTVTAVERGEAVVEA